MFPAENVRVLAYLQDAIASAARGTPRRRRLHREMRNNEPSLPSLMPSLRQTHACQPAAQRIPASACRSQAWVSVGGRRQ